MYDTVELEALFEKLQKDFEVFSKSLSQELQTLRAAIDTNSKYQREIIAELLSKGLWLCVSDLHKKVKRGTKRWTKWETRSRLKFTK